MWLYSKHFVTTVKSEEVGQLCNDNLLTLYESKSLRRNVFIVYSFLLM